MSQQDANLVTLWLVSLAFPVVGLAKLYLANVMVRNTHTRTRIGDWLVRMFIAIGVTFILIGGVYGLALANLHQWVDRSAWATWGVRIAAVTAVLLSLLSTAMLVKHLIPLLREFETMYDADSPQSVARELLSGLGIIAAASLGLLGLLMLIADWI